MFYPSYWSGWMHFSCPIVWWCNSVKPNSIFKMCHRFSRVDRISGSIYITGIVWWPDSYHCQCHWLFVVINKNLVSEYFLRILDCAITVYMYIRIYILYIWWWFFYFSHQPHSSPLFQTNKCKKSTLQGWMDGFSHKYKYVRNLSKGGK